MLTVKQETSTLIRRTERRARSALQEFHQLIQEFGEEDVRSCLGNKANDAVFEACHLLFGAQISLFQQEVSAPHAMARKHA